MGGRAQCAMGQLTAEPVGETDRMHAVTIPRPGGPDALVWAEVPDPEPGPGQVLIDVAASAVNRADLLQRQGHYSPPAGAPAYPGLECSGVISATGPGVADLRPGDQVCALLSGGGYAERVAAPARQVLPVPRGVTVEDAAALPEAACTVWSNVVDIARLRAGETLLVHGGGSGIGTFAIQLAVALGATVIATARAAKHDALKRLGAETTIDYTATDFVVEAKAVTGGRGVDVILDIMGAAYLSRNVAALAPNGRIANIGLQGGRTAELDLAALMAARGSISATTLRARPPAEKAAVVRGTREQVWPLIESGAIRPVIDRRIPMSRAADAHRLVESNEHVGKVLLIPG
jgi:putative PIG3 family NAD(P)H quinone oxidoreductase